MVNSVSHLGRVRLMPIIVVVVGLVMTMKTDLTRPGNEWLAGFGKLALCEVIYVTTSHKFVHCSHGNLVSPHFGWPHIKHGGGALNEESNHSTFSTYSPPRGFNPLPPWVSKKHGLREYPLL